MQHLQKTGGGPHSNLQTFKRSGPLLAISLPPFTSHESLSRFRARPVVSSHRAAGRKSRPARESAATKNHETNIFGACRLVHRSAARDFAGAYISGSDATAAGDFSRGARR